MSKAGRAPSPPKHLSAEASAWFEELTSIYDPLPHELTLIEQAATALDRAEECRRILEREGLTQADRFGQVKPHPLLREETALRDLVRRTIASLRFESP